MSSERTSGHKSDSFEPKSSAKERSAVRYALFILLVIYLAIGGMLAELAIENESALLIGVQLTLFSSLSFTVPVGLLLLLSGAVGALLLYVTAVLSAWRERRELIQLRKLVAELEQAQRTGTAAGTGGRQPNAPAFLIPMPGRRGSDSALPGVKRPG